MLSMENNYRNNNNNQQNHSGYPSTRAQYFNNNNNNGNNKNRKKNQRSNENNYRSLPQNFINNYVTNVPMPQGYCNDMSSSFDSYQQQQQQHQQQQQNFLTNHNRSPNKHHNYRFNNNNKKRFGRSNSNHNMQMDNNMNNSFESSPRKGVTASPSDSAINSYLTSSGEFNSILNSFKTSPTKLAPAIEEIKMVVSTQTTIASDILPENCNQNFLHTRINQNTDVCIEETTIQYDNEVNSTVINNRLSVSVDNNELQVDKEFDLNGPRSADQSEISENQYFSANETNQAQSSSSSSTDSSPSRDHLNSNENKNDDDSLIKSDDTVNKTINNETINNCETKINEENNLIMNSNLDYIESEGDYPRIKNNDDENNLGKDGIEKTNFDEDDITKKELLTINNNTNYNDQDDSINSSESSKTITSNISDLEIDTNGTSKSSECSDLENIKLRTMDSDDLSSKKSNDEDRDEDEESEQDFNNGSENHLFKEQINLDNNCVVKNYTENRLESETECDKTENNEKNCKTNYETQIVETVKIINDDINKINEVIDTEKDKEINELIQNESSIKTELILDEELKEVVEKIVSEVITNAVTILVEPSNCENKNTIGDNQTDTKIETEKLIINIDNVEDFEIINTKVQEIESLKVDYNDDDVKSFNNNVENEIIIQADDDSDTVVIDTAIVTMNKNIENQITIEYNNRSFQDEINQHENEYTTIVKLNELNDALKEVKNDETVLHATDANQTTINRETSERRPKTTKKITTSEVDCFGCTIL